MGRLVKWKKEDWGILVESDGEARPCMTIAIGEKEMNGVRSHITEDIYQDIMECIAMNNSFYRVYVNYNEIPKIVTYYDGELVAGNKYFADMKSRVMGLLKKVYLPDLVKAYLDLQKEVKGSPSVEIVRNRLKDFEQGQDALYQLMFLKPIIEEYLEQEVFKFKENPLTGLEDHELRELIISIRYGNKMGTKNPAEIVPGLEEAKVKEVLMDEVYKRFLRGGH